MRDALARREKLLLDGGMGTALLARGFDPAQETAASWNVSRPGVVLEIHREFVAAGADVVLTNTFGRVAPTRAESHAAIALARQSGARFVAASLWAGTEGLAAALHDLSDADAIWLETATSLAQAREALLVARDATKLPIIVTLAVFPPPALGELRTLGAAAVGFNCSPWDRTPGRLAQATRGLDVVKPDAAGMAPEAWAPEFARCDVPLVGGCCGATPAHLAAVRATLR